MRRATTWRMLQAAAGLLVIGLALRHLVRNWSEFRQQDIVWALRPGWILLSLVTVGATYALLIEAWRRVVVGQGERLRFWPAARIWLLASLGKYIPGKVWAIAGAAILAERAGVRRTVAVTAALVLQALALGAGLLVVSLTGPEVLGASPGTRWAGIALGVVALCGVSLLAWPRGLRAVLGWLPPTWPRFEPIPPRVAAAALSANVVAWSGYGWALVCLTRGLLPGTALGWATATSVFTASYLVGLVVLLAPAGLGPRESLFILLLSPELGTKAAVALAVASRLLLTVTELGAALPFAAGGWRTDPGTTTAPRRE